jgi:hypothetical protein
LYIFGHFWSFLPCFCQFFCPNLCTGMSCVRFLFLKPRKCPNFRARSSYSDVLKKIYVLSEIRDLDPKLPHQGLKKKKNSTGIRDLNPSLLMG